MRRALILLILSMAVLLALGGAAWRGARLRQLRAGLDQADREIATGQLDKARERLEGLEARWPESAEVADRQGACEAAAGKYDEALAAWERVPAASPIADRSRVARARALINARGAFRAAEPLLRAAMEASGPDAADARWTLATLVFSEGRLDELRRLLRDGWDRLPPSDQGPALRELLRLETVILSPEEIRVLLEAAARWSPKDDRVWLARAALATHSGREAEADRWLLDCERARPGDPAVLRARLEWAITFGRPADALRTLATLPADRLEPAEALNLRAWFAAQRGDRGGERRALEDLVELTPGDAKALERLGALAFEAGDTKRAAELRARKAKIDRDMARYRRVLRVRSGTESPTDLEDLARLAEALGRWFEARGWWQMVLRRRPSDPEGQAALARLAPRLVPRPRDSTLSPAALAAALDVARPREPTAEREPKSSAPPPAIAFRNDAEASGLRFVYNSGETKIHQIPETLGGGVGLLDYDGDGWLDVYLVQGGEFPPGPSRTLRGDRLFRNRRDGTFEDVTEASGLAGLRRGYGNGVAVGDFDGDGLPDVFVTRWRSYALYRNRGDGTFEDATETAGLGGNRDWPTSAAFADLDGDGDLDLYVCHYLAWNAENPRLCPYIRRPGRYVSCLPIEFPALPDHLFRNDGGRFTDVSIEAGIIDRDGRGLGVVAADLNEDGRVDLFVADDMSANLLFVNRGNMKFTEEGFSCGVACNADGVFRAGMGVALGDLDGDGRCDLAVTNFYGESITLYHNLGGGIFSDESSAFGLTAPTRFLLGFGVVFFDVDNDGQLDLAAANGHVNDYTPDLPHAMPSLLLRGGSGGRLTDVTSQAGPAWSRPVVGRGLASGDLDNDGRLDVVLVPQNTPVISFHNEAASGHSATFALAGTASNRDAIGATVRIKAGGRSQVAQRFGGGSYQSASDPRLHFGLGPADRIDEVEVTWPSGRIDRHRDLAADTEYLLREGATPIVLHTFGVRFR